MIQRRAGKLKRCIQESLKILRKTPGLPAFTLAKTCAKMKKGTIPSAAAVQGLRHMQSNLKKVKTHKGEKQYAKGSP